MARSRSCATGCEDIDLAAVTWAKIVVAVFDFLVRVATIAASVFVYFRAPAIAAKIISGIKQTLGLGPKAGQQSGPGGPPEMQPTPPPATPKPVAGVEGFTGHGVEQAINRGVKPSSILDALKNPLEKKPVVIDSLGRPGQRIIGREAEVVINPQTKKIISVNPTSTKKAQRLLRQQGGQ